MDVKIYIPHLALQEFITSISTVSAVLPEGINEVVTPYPPTPFQSLIFYCENPISMRNTEQEIFARQPQTVLLGPQLSRVNIKVHQKLNAIRVDFFPGGMFRLMGIPMNDLLDAGFDAVDFFGAEMREVNEKLMYAASLEDGKCLVENFLLQKLAKLKCMLPFDLSMKTLLKLSGNLTVEEAASLACLSIKQFERKCKERIGMSPKAFSRILRFSKAYRLHESCPHLLWTEIAHAVGYYDQMHMIKDFKVFAGVNPSIIEQQLQSTPLRMQRDLPF